MTDNIQEFEMENMHPLISEAIRDGGQFILTPKGTSMFPTIEPLCDTVVLCEPIELKKFDIVLYKRKTGTYVLHRITNIKNGKYTMCGDNQFYLEKGIEESQIIAVTSEIRKKDGTILTRDILTDKRRNFPMEFKRLFKRFYYFVKGKIYSIYKHLFKSKV